MTNDLVKRLRTIERDYDRYENDLIYEAADRIEELEKALMVAAGYISTKEGHTDQHPQDVYDFIIRAALEKKDD